MNPKARMNSGHRQHGMTLIGFVVVLMVLGFFAYCGMKLLPIYQEHWAVLKAMEGVKAEPGSGAKSAEQIKVSLDKKFYISYVSSVKPENIIITRASGATKLQIKYEVRDKFAFNLDIVASFDDTVNLGN